MRIAVLTLQLYLFGCGSLKEKRGRLKPLIARLHREYNLSVAEVAHQDVWQTAVIACAVVSSDADHNQRTLQAVSSWVKTSWPEVEVVSDKIELF